LTITRTVRGLWAALLLAFSGIVFAHGELHALIDQVTVRMAADPSNVSLVIRRAELHRLHHAFEAADADYARALSMAPNDPEPQWMRARSRLEGGRPEAALAELDAFIAAHPGHGSALLTRARTNARLERYQEAAADYAAAIAALREPEPDVIVEWIRAQKLAGIDHAVMKRAIDGVIARLGSIPVVEEAAYELEIEMRDWDAALARLDRRARDAARQEQWLFRRGQLLKLAQRDAEAAVAFERCLAAIQGLPAGLGSNPAMTTLARNATAELATLAR
jgi:tetratricopeptide (TPR) repeat protein